VNYEEFARSNYVRVKDPSDFHSGAQRAGFNVHKRVDAFGETRYAISADEGWPSSIEVPRAPDGDEPDADGGVEEVEFDIDAFFLAHLAEGEVAVCMAAGRDGRRYVRGHARAIAWDGRVEWINLGDIYDIAEAMTTSPVTAAEY